MQGELSNRVSLLSNRYILYQYSEYSIYAIQRWDSSFDSLSTCSKYNMAMRTTRMGVWLHVY